MKAVVTYWVFPLVVTVMGIKTFLLLLLLQPLFFVR